MTYDPKALVGHPLQRAITRLKCEVDRLAAENAELQAEVRRLRAIEAAAELPQGWRRMRRGGRFDPAVIKTLLVSFTVPLDAGLADDADPDDEADGFCRIISEEWWRNSAHEPDYFEPLGVSILPGPPMWVTSATIDQFKRAKEIALRDALGGEAT